MPTLEIVTVPRDYHHHHHGNDNNGDKPPFKKAVTPNLESPLKRKDPPTNGHDSRKKCAVAMHESRHRDEDFPDENRHTSIQNDNTVKLEDLKERIERFNRLHGTRRTNHAFMQEMKELLELRRLVTGFTRRKESEYYTQDSLRSDNIIQEDASLPASENESVSRLESITPQQTLGSVDEVDEQQQVSKTKENSKTIEDDLQSDEVEDKDESTQEQSKPAVGGVRLEDRLEAARHGSDNGKDDKGADQENDESQDASKSHEGAAELENDASSGTDDSSSEQDDSGHSFEMVEEMMRALNGALYGNMQHADRKDIIVKSLHKLRELADHSEDCYQNCAHIARCGGIASALRVLTDVAPEGNLHPKALQCLWALTVGDPLNAKAILGLGGAKAILGAMEMSPDAELVQINGCGSLFALSAEQGAEARNQIKAAEGIRIARLAVEHLPGVERVAKWAKKILGVLEEDVEME